MVSNPPALSSWQIALYWFVSILMTALLKLESKRSVVLVVPLQRVASNNDTLSLSLLSGVPLTKTMMTRVIVMLVTVRNVEK